MMTWPIFEISKMPLASSSHLDVEDPKFQEHGGKTRLRGKGIGGPHEGDATWQRVGRRRAVRNLWHSASPAGTS